MKKLKVTKLHGAFLAMNLLPILLMGLVITLFSSNRFAASMYHEVQGRLMDLCNTIQVTIDELYPGAYHVKETENAIYFMKGDHVLNGDYGLLDSVKKAANVEITIFYQDIRVATTLENPKGERVVGTQASPVVKRNVLEKADDMFYSSVMVGDERYFAYYAPLFAEDGSCIGMIFVAQPSANVERLIRNSITPMVVIAVLVMILVAFVTIRYTTGLVDTIKKIETYMANIAKGHLHDALDYEVLKREDELGEMGRNAVRMQKSLRELVEEVMNEFIREMDTHTISYKEKTQIHVTMTFGIVQAGGQFPDIDSMVSGADRRLYIGKQNGRNRIVTDEQSEQDL